MILVAATHMVGHGRIYRFYPEHAADEAMVYAITTKGRIFLPNDDELLSEKTVAGWVAEREAQGDFISYEVLLYGNQEEDV